MKKRNVVPAEHAVALVWNTLKTSGIYRMTLIQIAELLNWTREDTKALLNKMEAEGFVPKFQEAH